MEAQNTMHAAAIQAGYGLATARAVGRNVARLRRIAENSSHSWVGRSDENVNDLRTLEAAGLVLLVGRGSDLRWCLTDAGRALAAKL